ATLPRPLEQVGAVAPDQVARHHRAPDRRRVAADLLAAAVEGVPPVAEHLDVQAREVPLRALARNQRKRALRALAADQERDRVARWLRVRLPPDLAHRRDAGLEPVEAFLLGVEGDAEDRVLVLVPARAHAEDEP